MRIAFLCKRRYMGKDVILDRYARLYEIPYQLARMGHEVRGYCFDYHAPTEGAWQHEAAPGTLAWESRAMDGLKAPALLGYPLRLRERLKAFRPDVLVAASDIPHVALGHWLSRQLQVPCVVDLYDNFEGFGQARIPGFVAALRAAARHAALVTTTSEPLRQKVLTEYEARGMVVSMPSSVDLTVFMPGDQQAARQRLGLPLNARLVGTAGGLYRDKGVAPIYAAWPRLAERHADVHLVLAGPFRPELAPPQGERVHYLGQLAHDAVADLFRALDVGIISILDTEFGRYCFPQKAYEMLACGLPVAVARVGEMASMFAPLPQVMFEAGDADSLAAAVDHQLTYRQRPEVPLRDWQTLMSELAPLLTQLGQRAQPSSA